MRYRWLQLVLAATLLLLAGGPSLAHAAPVSGSPGDRCNYGESRDWRFADDVGAVSDRPTEGSNLPCVNRVRPRAVLDSSAPQTTRPLAEIGPGRVCLRSFSGDTEVLMADGTTKPISEIESGEMVWALDPQSGEAGARVVMATWPHDDTLLEFAVEGGSVTTTEDHHFWNHTDGEWQETDQIDPGDYLLTADGQIVEAGTLDWSTAHSAKAYDLTVEETHTYFVSVGEKQVLVHNYGKWVSPDEFADAVVRDARNAYRNLPTETGRHASGLRAAARDLRTQVANNEYLPEINERLLDAASRFEARARGINHPGGGRR